VVNLSRISSISTLAKSEGGMDYWCWYVPKQVCYLGNRQNGVTPNSDEHHYNIIARMC
jgi:hypothetical protein